LGVARPHGALGPPAPRPIGAGPPGGPHSERGDSGGRLAHPVRVAGGAPYRAAHSEGAGRGREARRRAGYRRRRAGESGTAARRTPLPISSPTGSIPIPPPG